MSYYLKIINLIKILNLTARHLWTFEHILCLNLAMLENARLALQAISWQGVDVSCLLETTGKNCQYGLIKALNIDQRPIVFEKYLLTNCW